MQITDRSKDVIKSGGEWISSIDLENAAMAHPAVAEAAVIGVAHPKWDERPLLIVQKKPDARARQEGAARSSSRAKVAKWWLPDDVVFVEAIPHTATGKILKTKPARGLQGLQAADGVDGVVAGTAAFMLFRPRASRSRHDHERACDARGPEEP